MLINEEAGLWIDVERVHFTVSAVKSITIVRDLFKHWSFPVGGCVGSADLLSFMLAERISECVFITVRSGKLVIKGLLFL